MSASESSVINQVEIVGTGLVVADHRMIVPDYPQEDTKISGQALPRQVGGPVPTGLTMLKRLGHSCRMIGSWGADDAGAFITQQLKSEGIDLQYSLLGAERETGLAHIWINEQTGRRTVVSHRPRQYLEPADFQRQMFVGAKCLYLDGWPVNTSIAAAKLARECGLRVFLDAGSYRPGLEDLLPFVDVLNASRRMIQEFLRTDSLEDAAARLQALGPRWVITTFGEAGAVLHTRSHVVEQEAFHVVTRDTNGAGDVFCGSFVHGWLENWPADYTLRFACAAGAIKCSHHGNRDALPTLGAIFRMAGPIPLDEDEES
ncbi:Ribokinase [Planctopirus ephydatiae]|uniref:Ribokinase n=1 Tax=Planctopirus ephydatiae TaxID=2528019 RepID=A0A518GRF5_9PLAN|nr:carbohydrate kinase family protein [Planctopirus ephydatiae]QDV31174.1 Ribokinase [Planctopirus ephydatiae]